MACMALIKSKGCILSVRLVDNPAIVAYYAGCLMQAEDCSILEDSLAFPDTYSIDCRVVDKVFVGTSTLLLLPHASREGTTCSCVVVLVLLLVDSPTVVHF